MENRILDKIKSIVDLMDELDDVIEKLPSSQSKVDSLLSDYRHLLKENVFKEGQKYGSPEMCSLKNMEKLIASLLYSYTWLNWLQV